MIDINFSRSLLTVLSGTQYRRQKLWMTWICRGMTSILLIVQLLSVALSVDQRHRKSKLARPSGYATPSQLISPTSKFIHAHNSSDQFLTYINVYGDCQQWYQILSNNRSQFSSIPTVYTAKDFWLKTSRCSD